MTDIQRLQMWYRSQCNGDWEHGHGIHIETLDNPGWHLSVNLVGTDIEQNPFDPLQHNVGDKSIPESHDWFTCYVKDGSWHGYGGPDQLATLVSTFLNWSGLTGR